MEIRPKGVELGSKCGKLLRACVYLHIYYNCGDVYDVKLIAFVEQIKINICKILILQEINVKINTKGEMIYNV